MSDKYVRILGEVTDLDDVRVGIGVDYAAVTIGQLRFSADQAEELAQLFVSACWQAGQQKARLDEEASDG